MKKLDGSKIVKLYTIGSMYNGNCIVAEDDKGNQYKIHMDELIKLMNSNVKFKAVEKKVHSYLTIISY